MDTEGTTLSAMLNDEPAADAPVVEAAPDAAPITEEAPDEPVRDEKGRFAAKTGVDDDTAPPAEGLPKEEYKAIREEREKRQTLERELEALRNTVQQLQQPKEPPPAPPSLWDDEQGALSHNKQAAVSEATFLARFDMSEMLASQAHEDFDEVKAKFISLMELNPALQQQALSAKHPWEKAYQIGKSALAAEQLGAVDVADLEAKIEARLREEMQAQSPVPQAQSNIPPSLTGERNVGARSGPAWAGPPSLSDMLR